MKLEDINKIAFLKGIEPYGKSKLELIREIQRKEGFDTCFGTKMFTCKNINCLWRRDCQGRVRIVEIV